MFQRPADFPADQSHFSFPVSGGGGGFTNIGICFQLTELLYNICPLVVIGAQYFLIGGQTLPA